MTQGYAYNAPRDSGTTRIVAITAVDPVSRTASGMTREHSTIMINCSYPVGGLLVTPAVGEQWYVQRVGVEYVLLTRLPANSPELLVEAAEGQVQVGSTGPLTLHGSEVQVGSKLKLGDTLYRDTGGALQSSTDGGLNWTTLITNTGGGVGVLSVAGKTGQVTLLPSDIETLTGILAAKADLVSGVIPASQLPSMGVQRFPDQLNLPRPGEPGVLYIGEDTWDVYLWDNDDYILVGGPSLAEAIPGPANITQLLESWTGINFSEGPIAFVVSIFNSVIRTFENLTGIDFSNGPLEFAKSVVRAIQGLLDIQNWIDLFEEWTNLDFSNGLISFIKSIFQAFSIPFVENLERLTGIDLFEVFANSAAMFQLFMEKIWGTLDQGIIKQFVDWFENTTGLVVRSGPGAFFSSLGTLIFSALDGFISAVENLFGNLTSATFNLPIILTTFIGNLISAPLEMLGQFLEALENTGWGLVNALVNILIDVISWIPLVGQPIAEGLRFAWKSFVTFVRGATKAANNLIKDTGFENSRSWSQTDIEINREFAYCKSGLVSIKITSGGSTPKSFYWNVDDQGDIIPIVTQTAEVFYAEAYVLYPTTVGNNGTTGTVTLVAEFIDSSGILPTTTSTVDKILSKTNVWQKISGGFIVPGGGANTQYDRINFGLRLGSNNTTLNDKFFVDEIVVKETTASQNTIDGIHQAIYGGTGTLKSVGDVKDAVGGITDLTRGNVQSGPNILADPKVNASRFWKGTGLAVRSEYYRSTSQSLRLTSAGADADRYFYFNVNDTGASPVFTKPGNIFYVECHVFSPTTNSSSSIVRMKGWGVNSITDALENITADAGSLTVALNPIRGNVSPSYPGGNPWTKLYGYYTIPEGYDGFIAGIVLAAGETTSGNNFFIDDMVVQDVTAVVKTNNALYGSPEAGSTINESALPSDIPQGKISNLPTTITQINLGITGASGAAADAAAAASGANTKVQGTIDGINQAINGGSTTGQNQSTVKTNLQNLNQALFRQDTYPGRTGRINTDAVPVLDGALGRNRVPELQDAIDGINQVVNNSGTTGAAASTVKFNLAATISGIVNGLKGGASASKTDWSAADLLTAGTDTSKAISLVSGQVAKIIAANTSAAVSGNSYSVDFTATKLPAGSPANTITSLPSQFSNNGGLTTYQGSGSGTINVLTGTAQVTGATATGDLRKGFAIYAFDTQEIYHRSGITCATGPGAPPWFVAEGAFNYIVVRSNGVNPFSGGGWNSSASLVYARLGAQTCEVWQLSGGSHTRIGNYAGSFRFKSGATYWLQAGSIGTNPLPNRFTLYENESPLLVCDGTASLTGKKTGFGGEWRTFTYGLAPYAMLPGAVAGWYAFDTKPPAAIGSGFRATRTTPSSTPTWTYQNGQTAAGFNSYNIGNLTYYYGPLPGGYWNTDTAIKSGGFLASNNIATVPATGWYCIAARVVGSSSSASGFPSLLLATKATGTGQSWQIQQSQMNLYPAETWIEYLQKDTQVQIFIQTTAQTITLLGTASGGGSGPPSTSIGEIFSIAFLNNAAPIEYSASSLGAAASINPDEDLGSYGA